LLVLRNGKYVLGQSVLRHEDNSVTVDVELETTDFLAEIASEW
jgi:hypothetical protein